MSWNELQEISDRSWEAKQASDIATLYFECFKTEAGQLVLKDLINKFLTRPIVRPNQDAYSQGIREGRADLVRQLINQIEFAKNPTDPDDGITKHILEKVKDTYGKNHNPRNNRNKSNS